MAATAITGGVYAPPTYQTDPAAVKRIMAVYLERDTTPDGTGALTIHAFTLRHTDPRKGKPVLTTYAPVVLRGIAHAGWLSSAIAHALMLECGALWILESVAAQDLCQQAALDLMAATEALERAGDNPPFLVHELSAGKHATELAGLVVQRRREDTGKGQGAPVGVYFTWVGSRWPTPTPPSAPDAYQIADYARAWLEAVTLAAYAMNQQLRFSPSYSGITTLRRSVAAAEARRGAALARLSDARTAEVLEAKPTYLQWRSSFAAHDLQPHWTYTNGAAYIPLHVYDRNWSYVTAAREVPIGEPVATSEYVPSDPGYYRILSATPPPTWSPDRWTSAPGPFHWRGSDETDTSQYGYWPNHALHDLWAWEAQIRQALRLGWRVEVEYGWRWPNRYDLRQWQTAMFGARREATSAYHLEAGVARMGEQIVKAAGVSAIGRLNQRSGRAVMRLQRARALGADILSRHVDNAGELTGFGDVVTTTGRDDMYRPEWWATIISNANERTLAAIYQYAASDTILAYVDGIYTLARHDELDGPSGKPGGWRYKGAVYLPVADIDRLDTLSPYELVVALAGYAGRSGPVVEALERAGGAAEAAAEDE